MKQYLLIGLFTLLSLLLFSCTSTQYHYSNDDYLHETWQREIESSPNKWAAGADSWFLNGNPNSTELADRNASYSDAISMMTVRVPDFTNVKINGDFQVQIFGTDNPNSVFVYGPNAGVHELDVEVHGNTLWINQLNKVPVDRMKRVIVRIGMRQINNLTTSGCATVEGIGLHSNNLNISSFGNGNIYLGGCLNVRCITQAGSGCVTVFGVNTPSLEIRTSGSGGSVNVTGYVGLKCIEHTSGATNINIIGAVPTQPLKIYADGTGKIGINGLVNLKEVTAKGNTCVYVARTQSNSIRACATNNARIGVAGCTVNLYVDTFDNSRFEGRYLCAQNAYVKAHNNSHVNVAARNKVFASAVDNSAIYFFGSQDVLDSFVKNNGIVLTFRNDAPSCYCASRQYVGEG